MELTPKQRLLVYEKLLKVVCKDPSVDDGICFYLVFLLDGDRRMPVLWRSLGGVQKIKLLTELYNKKTTECFWCNNFGFWAPLTSKGWETRIRWIEKSIVEVKKLIK